MAEARVSAEGRASRKQARLEEIINVSAMKFAEKGFDATIQEIAKELGMTGAALYYYVDNKDQLLYEIWKVAGQKLQSGLEEEIARPGDPLEKLSHTFRRHLNVIISNRPIFEVLILQRSQMPLQGRESFIETERLYSVTLAELIMEVPEEQLKISDPRMLARAIIAMLNGVIRWYSEDKELSLDEIADFYFDVVTQGAFHAQPLAS